MKNPPTTSRLGGMTLGNPVRNLPLMPVTLAPPQIDPVTLTLTRVAPLKLALTSVALDRLAPESVAPVNVAADRLTLARLVPVSVAPLRLAPGPTRKPPRPCQLGGRADGIPVVAPERAPVNVE